MKSNVDRLYMTVCFTQEVVPPVI